MTAPTHLDFRALWAKYRKSISIVGVTVLAFVATVLTDGISAPEWVLLAGVTVNAVTVAIVPNLDAGIASVAKSITAFMLAGLTVAATAILGGLTPAEWTEIVLAAFAAVGVTALPNDWPPAQLPPAPARQVR
jgi:hypothetical protein